ncbi:MAG: VOC family protein, partial [Erythrobacter sp.]|nr:VOC family protein [Erythrobacter sp.]
VLGPTHHGIFKSIYFFDPNGHRVELAADIGTDEQYSELKRVAPLMLEEWSKTKTAPRHADWLHEIARAEHGND